MNKTYNMSNIYITELVLNQDEYYHILEALQLYTKSPKVTNENFDTVRNLYGHIKEQYGRRSVRKGIEGSIREKLNEATPAPAVKKVGVKAKVVVEDNEIEAHPFIASARQNWICTACGKSRNSSHHKTPEGKLWLPVKLTGSASRLSRK